MTSIEWLREELWQQFKWQFSDNIFEVAKVMHKQEIIEAYCNANDLIGAEQYYQETFVSNGTDEHIVDTNEMISEDKMLTEATNRYVIEDEIEAFIQGANWIQEKLKNETKI
jgi:hypothetical protein